MINIYPEWIDKFKFDITFTIGNQVLHFTPRKVFIHIPAHILLGIFPAWIGFLIFSNSWVGFAMAITGALFICGAQIFWENIYSEMYSEILMNVVDMLQYILGGLTVLIMLII